jgi:hypothetical protein
MGNSPVRLPLLVRTYQSFPSICQTGAREYGPLTLVSVVDCYFYSCWCGATRRGCSSCVETPHEPLPPDQQDLSPQEQAPLRKWLDGGLTTAALTIRRGRRQLDGGVGGDGSVMAARRRQWRRPEGDKGCGDDSMRAVTATAVDDGVGGGRRWSKRGGEEGRGGTTSQNCRPSHLPYDPT